MERKRRSGRIAKELEIVLLGTDTTGKVFSEETKTVVLSRHGAGLISRYRFAPDEVLTLRMPESSKEAEVRLVGQIGGESGRYVYGVEFVDPDPHFWPMDFAPPEEFEAASSIALECGRCQARQNVEHSEIEEDVYSVNGYVLRFCTDCGTSTHWKKAQGNVPTAVAAARSVPSDRPPESSGAAALPSNGTVAKTDLTAASLPHPPGLSRPDANLFVPVVAAAFRKSLTDSPPQAEQASSYSGTSDLSELASFADIETNIAPVSSVAAIAVLSPARPGQTPQRSTVALAAAVPELTSRPAFDANGRRANRRRHVRIRVSFSACVRHPEHADEVVECENVSKGGVCFHSLQQYELGSVIEVAAPFSPGDTALFMPAKIKRIEPLSGGQVFRYGVEYMNPGSSPTRA